jgi:L-seryl-tRNA(Ser) seleniumtransferase
VAERARVGGILETEVVPGQSAVGGGTTPGLELPTWVIALRRPTKSADWLDGWLRQQEVPVVGRIESDRLLLDLRTVLAEEDDLVAETLARIP